MHLFRAFFLKVLCVLLLAYVLQPPLNEQWKIGVFIGCLIIVMSGRMVALRRKHVAFALSVVCAVYLIHLIPGFGIREGHNALLFNQEKYVVLSDALPKDEYVRLEKNFIDLYPANKSCLEFKPVGCWRTYDGISAPYAFSPDGIYDKETLSRTVNDINFDSVRSFRGGFLNSLQAKVKSASGAGTSNIDSNWFPKEYLDIPGDPDKIDMPYFVRYDVNERMIGQVLCWMGDVVFYADGKKQQISEEAARGKGCYEFQRKDVGLQVWGFKLGNNAVLEMKLVKHLTIPYATLMFKNSLLAMMAVLLSIGCVQFRFKRFIELGLSSALVYGLGSFYTGDYFHKYFYEQFYGGGNDPLMHWGYARLIVQDFMAGHLKDALLGVEPVYFFMPGYRYFHALEMFVFGEASLASMLVFLCYPFVFFKICRLFVGLKPTLVLSLIFCAFLPRYMSWTLGFGELVCHPIALAGIYCLCRAYLDQDFNLQYGFFAGLCFWMAIFFRPDFSIPVFLICVSTLFLFSKRFFYGFAPPLTLVFLMLAHNLYYGGQFVPFTSSSGNPENLQLTLFDYYQSLLALFSTSSSVESLNKVRVHAIEWVKAPSGIFWVIFLVLFPILCVFKKKLKVFCEFSAWRKVFVPPMLFIVLFEIGLQLTHLFFKTTHRYSLFTGVLALIIIAYLLTHLLVSDVQVEKSSAI